MSLPRIAIVDDDANHRASLTIALRLDGFEVLDAEDAVSALELLESEPCDVALVDIMLPGTSGLELARKLRFRHPELRVVLTSAYHLTHEQLERSGLGAVGFVPKPYDLDELSVFLRVKAAGGRAAARGKRA